MKQFRIQTTTSNIHIHIEVDQLSFETWPRLAATVRPSVRCGDKGLSPYLRLLLEYLSIEDNLDGVCRHSDFNFAARRCITTDGLYRTTSLCRRFSPERDSQSRPRGDIAQPLLDPKDTPEVSALCPMHLHRPRYIHVLRSCIWSILCETRSAVPLRSNFGNGRGNASARLSTGSADREFFEDCRVGGPTRCGFGGRSYAGRALRCL